MGKFKLRRGIMLRTNADLKVADGKTLPKGSRVIALREVDKGLRVKVADGRFPDLKGQNIETGWSRVERVDRGRAAGWVGDEVTTPTEGAAKTAKPAKKAVKKAEKPAKAAAKPAKAKAKAKTATKPANVAAKPVKAEKPAKKTAAKKAPAPVVVEEDEIEEVDVADDLFEDGEDEDELSF